MHTTSLCIQGSHMCKKFIFGVFEQYLFTYGDSHMGICTHFAHKQFVYGDPHRQKCLKKHISDRLFLHNEVVRIWRYTRYTWAGGTMEFSRIIDQICWSCAFFLTYHVCLGIFDQICWAFTFFRLIRYLKLKS